MENKEREMYAHICHLLIGVCDKLMCVMKTGEEKKELRELIKRFTKLEKSFRE